MSLAQIGEFAFVLLSRASNLHLVEVSATAAVSSDDVYNLLCIERSHFLPTPFF